MKKELTIKNTLSYARAIIPIKWILKGTLTWYRRDGEWGVAGMELSELNALSPQAKKKIYACLYKLMEYEATRLSVDDVYDIVLKFQENEIEDKLYVGKEIYRGYIISALTATHGIGVNLDLEYPYCIFRHAENQVYELMLHKKISDVNRQFTSEVMNILKK